MAELNFNPNERSITDVFGDIVGHFQEIIRSEFLLAKVEVKGQAAKAVPAVTRLCAGIVLGLFAFGFFLLTIMFLLSIALPMWVGAFVVWVIIGPIAIVLVSSGLARLRRLRPQKTVRTVKENVQWAKEQMQ